MATGRMSEVVQHLRRSVLQRDGAGLTDGQLLEEYLGHRDPSALAALVRRHGPMVWGVCRRVLRHQHDAEDAFQATFLVLVRKADSLASRDRVANWLYGVAYQTALKARATAARRQERERQVTQMPEPAVESHDHRADLRALLDQELSRLPEKYRLPLLLCDLEGLTRAEAAQRLGCPEGTVAGRLARARLMLAKRLARHGLPVWCGVLASILAHNAAAASVPAGVVASTIHAADLVTAGQTATGAIAPTVAALTEGVLRTMLMTKLKVATAVLVVMACLGGGVVGLTYRTQAAAPPGTAGGLNGTGVAPGLTVPAGSGGSLPVILPATDLKARIAAAHKKFQESKDAKSTRAALDELEQAVGAMKSRLAVPPAPRTEIKIFKLRHASAGEMARVLNQLFKDKGPRIVSEPVTNAVLVEGVPKDLQVIEAVIARLDEEPKKK